MLKEIKTNYFHFFEDEQGRKQGEYIRRYSNNHLYKHCFYINDIKNGEFKQWYANNQCDVHCIYVNDKLHGEFKGWEFSGELRTHYFYINNIRVPLSQIPLPPCPATEEDRIYYLLKYNVQLLQVEQTC